MAVRGPEETRSMKGNRAVLTVAVIVLVAVVGWALFRRGTPGERIDLIEQFPGADKRGASGKIAEVIDVELAGEKKRAIYVPPNSSNSSRFIWKLRVPDDAWLRVAVGMKPEAWDKEGDGVLFRFGVSDGRTYDPLFTQHVNVFGRQADRRWIPVMVDLAPYAGEEVELIFNTNASEPGKPDDARNDFALWGAPEVIVR
jgi:hypothetical protein